MLARLIARNSRLIRPINFELMSVPPIEERAVTNEQDNAQPSIGIAERATPRPRCLLDEPMSRQQMRSLRMNAVVPA